MRNLTKYFENRKSLKQEKDSVDYSLISKIMEPEFIARIIALLSTIERLSTFENKEP